MKERETQTDPVRTSFRDPGPVPVTGRANFRGLPTLVGRDNDSGRFAAAWLLLVAVGFPLAVFLGAPATVAHAFGYAPPTVVTVVDVTESHHRRAYRHQPTWRVAVSWAQDGRERTGQGFLRGRTPPTQVGDQLTAQVWETGDGEADVSLNTATNDRALVFGVLAASLASVVGGVILFRSSGRRKKLLRVVGRTPPRRVTVRSVEPDPLVWEDSGRRQVISQVEFGPPDGSAGGGNVVLRSGEVDMLDPGDTIDLWANPGRGEQLVAVRRASDGTWWVGRG